MSKRRRLHGQSMGTERAQGNERRWYGAESVLWYMLANVETSRQNQAFFGRTYIIYKLLDLRDFISTVSYTLMHDTH